MSTLRLSAVSVITGPQPGGREPAPGTLGFVQSFLNSRWDLASEDPHSDQFATPDELESWLRRRHLLDADAAVSRAQWRRALHVRDGLHSLAFANNGLAPDRHAIQRLNDSIGHPHLYVHLSSSAPDFRADRRDVDAVLGVVATITALAQIDGTWRRLKACGGDDCGWTFYDSSRNQAGNWCAMSLCGSRTKAREYRDRHRRTQS